MSIERVAERVSHGGHDIPRKAIERRYPRSIHNLLNHYAPLCSATVCLDNFSENPAVIFVQHAGGRSIENSSLFEQLQENKT